MQFLPMELSNVELIHMTERYAIRKLPWLRIETGMNSFAKKEITGSYPQS
jgi:hypothetical protein